MKNKILILLFIGILSFFPIYSFVLTDQKISYSERRKLQTFPTFTINSLFTGEYFEKINNYFIDHFPFRDNFKKLKGITTTKVLNKRENNNTFIKNKILYQLEHTLDEKSIKNFTTVLTKVYKNNIITNKSTNIYYSIIPDKNYYLTDSTIPTLNYQKLFYQVEKNLPKDFKYIDITSTLTNNSYYKTDIHWKQEQLKPVVEKIATTMNFKINNYPTTKKTYSPFYGALYSRIASNIKPDTITYLTNKNLEKLKVFNYEKNVYEKIYEQKNLTNIDSYDIYLSGATPLLIINNPNKNNNKELILFRDSFGSSIAPLLIEAYSKITIIDLRYLNTSLLPTIKEISFNNPNLDILFLYSTQIINNSYTLK